MDKVKKTILRNFYWQIEMLFNIYLLLFHLPTSIILQDDDTVSSSSSSGCSVSSIIWWLLMSREFWLLWTGWFDIIFSDETLCRKYLLVGTNLHYQMIFKVLMTFLLLLLGWIYSAKCMSINWFIVRYLHKTN